MKASDSPSKRPSRNYFARREQVRLLFISGALTLTIALIYQAAQPETWRQLFGGASQRAAEVEPIDTRVPRKAVEDQPVEGAFRVVPPTPFTMNRSGAKLDPGKAAISAEQLAKIQDDSVFRQIEFEPWSEIFFALRKTPPELLTPAQAEPVQFAQLYRQPDEYRGKLVAISGVVKRVVRVDAEVEDVGVDHLWQIWLFTGADSNPMVIYCLGLPDQFPTHLDVSERVTIVGVFFKRWLYAGKGGIFTAPLLLSKSIVWVPPPPVRPLSIWKMGLGVIVSVIAALVIATLIFRKSNDSDSAVEHKIRERQADKFRAEADELNPGLSVRDQLQIVADELAKRTGESESDGTEHE